MVCNTSRVTSVTHRLLTLNACPDPVVIGEVVVDSGLVVSLSLIGPFSLSNTVVVMVTGVVSVVGGIVVSVSVSVCKCEVVITERKVFSGAAVLLLSKCC